MKDLILKKKGLGILVVLAVALLASIYVTATVKTFVNQAVPLIQQEVSGFLPITVQGGEIVAPKDAIISKDYDNGAATVVLDTRVSEFEPSSLTKTGVYVSRKYIYTYNGNKIEIYNLNKFPDMVIDEQTVTTFSQTVQQYSGKFIFFALFIGFAFFMGLGILIYTVLVHWLMMAWVFHVGFSHTLRISTLTYSLLALLTIFAHVSFSFLINLVIILAANVAVNTMDKKA